MLILFIYFSKKKKKKKEKENRVVTLSGRGVAAQPSLCLGGIVLFLFLINLFYYVFISKTIFVWVSQNKKVCDNCFLSNVDSTQKH
jgi:hypothetical protein